MRGTCRRKSSVMSIPNCQNFATCYMELCREKKLRPLPVICVTLPHSLDFTTDRVKMDDWGPILNSLSLDRSLRSVSVRSRYRCRKPLEEVNSAEKARAIGRAPVVLTRYLLEWLSHSVAQCIRNSPTLTCLELEGVPLPDDCLATLCVGLSGTESLQHLSLQRCYIGNKSCALVCRTIADVHSIRSLNLSECDLSNDCGGALAEALSRQKLLLYHETWKESLRYREPNLDAMPGLRRLSLNGNPYLGDSAVAQIVDAIQDSLWLKALDLQNCGLTTAIGNEILQLLEHNTTLQVIDLRCNANLNEEVVEEVFNRLDVNNAGCKLEYRFLGQSRRENRTLSMEVRRREDRLVRNAKRSCQRTLAKRTKAKPPTSHFPIARREITVVKPLLHLDLQTKIKSALDEEEEEEGEEEEEDDEEDEDEDDDEETDNNANNSAYNYDKSSGKRIKFNKIFRHPSVLKQEEKLINEMRQMRMELKEERAQRELAETKLRMMREDLEDVANTLKAKEIETQGYLLISQNSLDEISKIFEQLLIMLEEANAANCHDIADEEEVREKIKRKVTLFLRKTKSEKIRKDILELESLKKLTKSTGDIRVSLLPSSPSSSPPPILSQLEKKIGDTRECVTLGLVNDSGKEDRRGNLNDSFSSCERARALFAQIINGDIIVNLGRESSQLN